VIDTSPSMEEKDYPPSRLAAAKSAAEQFVSQRKASGVEGRIGQVHFGEIASVGCRLTPCENDGAIKASIEKMSVIQGTNITSGLLAAESLFNQSRKRGAVQEVRLLTDGTHNVGPLPHEVAERMKGQGCIIYTLGIGGHRKAVDEALLKQICSRNENGEPLYEFISDRQGLMRYFGNAGGLTR
jgi:Ca-activated chloride channel family protein